MRNAYNNLIGNMKGRDNMEYLFVDARILLKWTLKKAGVSQDWIHRRAFMDMKTNLRSP
jgi:hypothetical protein